jgi:hypothetical protein
MLLPLIELYGGDVYIDKGEYTTYKWYISSQKDILNILDYFRLNPPKTLKKNRILLVLKYYELKLLGNPNNYTNLIPNMTIKDKA